MFLAQTRVISPRTGDREGSGAIGAVGELEEYAGPEVVGGSKAGADVLRLLHRDIASFL